MRKFRIINNNGGSVLLLCAISIVMLLGICAIAIDLSRLYIAQRHCQKVCDSAAQAGLQIMTANGGSPSAETAATAAAIACADANNSLTPSWSTHDIGAGTTSMTVSYPSGTFTDYSNASATVQDGEAIKTEARVTVEFGFARIFGLQSKEVYASCTGIIELALGPSVFRALPLCISDHAIFGPDPISDTPLIPYGTQLTFTQWQWDNSREIATNEIAAVAMPNDVDSANVYQQRLSASPSLSQQSFDLGPNMPTPVMAMVGNLNTQTIRGFQNRLANETDPRFLSTSKDATAWSTWSSSYNPSTGQGSLPTWRCVTALIIDDQGADAQARQANREALKVVGIAGLFIERFTTPNGNDPVVITTRLISAVRLKTDIIWTSPNSTQGLPDSTLAPRVIQ